MQRRVVTTEPLNASTPITALRDDVTPAGVHYVRSHFPAPVVNDADAWEVSLRGHVAQSFSLTVAELRALPARTVAVTLECAGNGRTRMRPVPGGTPWDDGAVGTARWTGVPLRALLERAGVQDDALEVLFRGADEGQAGGRRVHFERSLPLADALHEDALLAYALGGEPLPPEHGFPVRLVVPSWYAVASVKWLTHVEVRTEPFRGHYQADRYTYDGEQPAGKPPEPVTRMRVRALLAIAEATRFTAGETVRLEGRAWSGHGDVTRVEVSMDAGLSWQDAELAPPMGPHAWRRFSTPWTPTTPGHYALMARATDAAGHVQPTENPWNHHGYGNNSVLPVNVHVD